MSTVYLGLGSNIDPLENLRRAIKDLENRFGKLESSSVYRSAAYGFDGDDFLNMVTRLETELRPEEVYAETERIQRAAGRDRTSRGYTSRTLDIDLLLFDDLIINKPPIRLPRQDVLKFGFVLCPLAEIAPDFVHPETRLSVQEHWSQFDADDHPITRESIIP